MSLCESCRSRIASLNVRNYWKKKYGHIVISSQAKQIILGSILGDGCLVKTPTKFGNYGLKVMHGMPQKEYCKWKSTFFTKAKFKIINKKNSFTGKPSKFPQFITRSMPQVTSIVTPYLINGKKHISEKIISDIDLLGIAIWYFDDGSISKPKRYENGYCKDGTIRFSTYAFSSEEIHNLKEVLRQKCGVTPLDFSMRKGNKVYHGIRLFGDDVRRFISLIRTVPEVHKAHMDYKIPSDLSVTWKRCKINNAMRDRLTEIFGKTNQSQIARDLKCSRKKVWDMLQRTNPWEKSGPSGDRLALTMKLFGTTNQSEAARKLGVSRKKIWELLAAESA